jgi:hypothetical protein
MNKEGLSWWFFSEERHRFRRRESGILTEKALHAAFTHLIGLGTFSDPQRKRGGQQTI